MVVMRIVVVVMGVRVANSSRSVMATINYIRYIKTPIILTPLIPSARSNVSWLSLR